MNEITVTIAVIPALRAFVWAFLLLGVLPVLLTSGAVYLLTKSFSPGVTGMITVIGVVMFGAALFLFLRNDISLTDQSLDVKAGFYRYTVDRSEILWEDVRLINPAADKELLPRVRSNGIGLPGYRAGWFVLQNGMRAFLLVTEGPLLYLPTSDGDALVLSVDRSSTLFQKLEREYRVGLTGK